MRQPEEVAAELIDNISLHKPNAILDCIRARDAETLMALDKVIEQVGAEMRALLRAYSPINAVPDWFMQHPKDSVISDKDRAVWWAEVVARASSPAPDLRQDTDVPTWFLRWCGESGVCNMACWADALKHMQPRQPSLRTICAATKQGDNLMCGLEPGHEGPHGWPIP